MNERTIQLYKQAVDFAYTTAGEDAGKGTVVEGLTAGKFAELIVQECISINRQRMFSEYEGDSHRVAHNNALLCATSDMFEHFGVEE